MNQSLSYTSRLVRQSTNKKTGKRHLPDRHRQSGMAFCKYDWCRSADNHRAGHKMKGQPCDTANRSFRASLCK